MPCYHPWTAYQYADGSIKSVERKGDVIRSLQLPCGQCVGCRLERSRQWAIRCMHEAQMHEQNCYITLTYADETSASSLHYPDFQKFMRRLRKHFKGKIRFYMAGEYGEDFGRPHFHACLFGIDFDDKKYLAKVGNFKLYRSPTLEKLWPYGFSSIGSVTFESAAYVARYIMKKINGDLADDHYQVVDLEKGEIVRREPEFCHMSLKPGIGFPWLQKYSSDIYSDGQVVVRGKKCKPPRYYDKKYSKVDPLKTEDIQYLRQVEALTRIEHSTDERLAVREKVTLARLSLMKRKLR